MIIKIVCAGENHFANLYQYDEDEYIIAVDGGLESLSNKGLKADLLIGDFDSSEISENSNLYKEKITFEKRKDESDLELAINYAVKLNHEKIIIYNATGNRLDHFYASLLVLGNNAIYNIEIVNNDNRIRVINKTTEIKKDKYKYVSFFALEENAIISLSGFSYNVEDYLLKPNDPLCLSNEVINKGIIEINNKKILIIESK